MKPKLRRSEQLALNHLKWSIAVIHWNYGKGDIRRIDHENHRVWAQCTSCAPHSRKFRVVNGVLHFLGHRKQLPRPKGGGR